MRAFRILGPDDTARADVLAAIDQVEALELELRGPGNHVVPTEYVHIVDTHYLLSIPHEEPDDVELDPEMQKEIDEWVAELHEQWESEGELTTPEETEFQRYQVQIQLLDGVWLP